MFGKKSKILYVSHSAGISGAEQCLFTLVKNLDKNRFVPMIVLPSDGPLKKSFESIGIETKVLPLICWVIPIYRTSVNCMSIMMDRWKNIASLIEKEAIDIVHTNSSIIAEGAIAAKMTGRPHIWHLHEFLKGHPSLKPTIPLYFTYRFIDLLSDAVIVVSKALKESISGAINQEKIRVIYNGIDPVKEEGGSISFRRALRIPRENLLVCTIGAFIKEKGYHTFIDAAKIVLERKKNVSFVIIGNIGNNLEYWDSIRERAKDRTLRNHIKFIHFRFDIWRILKEIDVYIVSSLMESFGLAAVEAMAAGKPVISTTCGGPEEVIEHGKTGILVQVNDPDSMAKAILTLANNPEKRNEMGLKGKKRYSELFTGDRFSRRVENLYLEIKKKGELNVREEEMSNALIELVVGINDNRLKTITQKKRAYRIGAFFKFMHIALLQYRAAWQYFGFTVANRKAWEGARKMLRSFTEGNR